MNQFRVKDMSRDQAEACLYYALGITPETEIYCIDWEVQLKNMKHEYEVPLAV